MNEVLIEINNLSFKYKKRQNFWNLKNINLKINKNEFHIFVGNNGAGKSTTINILIGSLLNYEGDLLINGLNPKNNFNARCGLSYFCDKPIFPSNMSIENYLYAIGSLTNDNKTYLKDEIEKLLIEFDLHKIKKNNPNKLSAGQKQKLLLIKTIIEKPRIIILDEPTSNLDPVSRLNFYSKLKNMQKELNSTIFISSHNIDEISKYADSATFIKEGQIIYNGKLTNDNLISMFEKIYSDNEFKNDGKIEF